MINTDEGHKIHSIFMVLLCERVCVELTEMMSLLLRMSSLKMRGLCLHSNIF
jgi:hypothetical protein